MIRKPTFFLAVLLVVLLTFAGLSWANEGSGMVIDADDLGVVDFDDSSVADAVYCQELSVADAVYEDDLVEQPGIIEDGDGAPQDQDGAIYQTPVSAYPQDKEVACFPNQAITLDFEDKVALVDSDKIKMYINGVLLENDRYTIEVNNNDETQTWQLVIEYQKEFDPGATVTVIMDPGAVESDVGV